MQWGKKCDPMNVDYSVTKTNPLLLHPFPRNPINKKEKMTTEEITAGNKLIAEFCEVGYWQAWRKEGYKPHWSTHYGSQAEVIDALKNHYGIESTYVAQFEAKYISPNYHSDWSLLMPVVEKIEALHSLSQGQYLNVRISQGYIQIEGTREKILYNTSIEGSKITALWQAVVQFLQWYNQSSLDNQ